MVEADRALFELLRELGRRGYRFVAPTPATHAIVVARAHKRTARDLRDIFGWSLPFERAVLSNGLFELLEAADMLAAQDGLYRSRVRVASLDSLLFLHSAFPTEARDAVFFGPDSYRFVRFVLAELETGAADRLIDIGAGSGAGAIAAVARGGVTEVLLTDVNRAALRFASINAAYAGVEIATRRAAAASAADRFPLAIMNPPFIADEAKRAYRDGGENLGAQASIRWALEAAQRISPGGRVLLYSGSAIAGGEDLLEAALRTGLPTDCSLRYAELDPDIFGEELRRPAYAGVERIAAIGAVITRDLREQGRSRGLANPY